MPSIIKTLVAEHRLFCALFDGVQLALSHLALSKIQRFTHQLELLLLTHAAAEDELVLLALKEVPADKPRYEHFHKEHHEIGAQLTQIYEVDEAARAQHLLRIVVGHSRRHFAHEERFVFPLLEEIIDREMLGTLGAIWVLQRQGNEGLIRALVKEFQLADIPAGVAPHPWLSEELSTSHGFDFQRL